MLKSVKDQSWMYVVLRFVANSHQLFSFELMKALTKMSTMPLAVLELELDRIFNQIFHSKSLGKNMTKNCLALKHHNQFWEFTLLFLLKIEFALILNTFPFLFRSKLGFIFCIEHSNTPSAFLNSSIIWKQRRNT